MTNLPDTIYYDEMDSPVGTLRLVADGRGLREIRFERERHPKQAYPHWVRAAAPLKFARVQLEEYFAGERQHFELPLHPVGTPFQLEVWHELGRIPYGVTISYGELAPRTASGLSMRRASSP